MPQYSIRMLDHNARVIGTRDVDYPAETDAMADAFALAKDYPMVELWMDARLIARVPSRV